MKVGLKRLLMKMLVVATALSAWMAVPATSHASATASRIGLRSI